MIIVDLQAKAKSDASKDRFGPRSRQKVAPQFKRIDADSPLTMPQVRAMAASATAVKGR